MIDLHSHIIWNVDDGSKSEEMTIQMLKKAEESGTSKIVATPHFFSGYFTVSREEIKEKVEEVKALAKQNNINIEIYQGQEVYYSDKIFEQYNEGLIGTINDSRYMLIEFPMREFSISEILDNLYELQLKGIIPVIAHPERYHRFIKEPRLINKFIDEGFLFQLNLGSIAGDFGKDVKNTAKVFIEHRVYNFIGSDAHRDEKRTTNMEAGLKELKDLDSKYIRYIEKSSESLLLNEEIGFIGKKIEGKKRGILSFFKK
ncbi:MAG: CpsB/CapC family capsule biosynthesis tyrosine phosphatase [Clostridium sp.]